jgi:hypothetical protein
LVAFRAWPVRPAAEAVQQEVAKAPKQDANAQAPIKEDSVPKVDLKPKDDAKQPAEQPPDLVVIFWHSPRKSVGKLVARGSPIPPGWQGGGGRILSIELSQRENQLSALLADGKVGQTATLTK